MMYVGYHGSKYSEILDADISILEYKIDSKIPYCDCSRCGKPLKSKMFVIQDRSTDVEMMCLGADCIKHFM